ncbi:MAG: ABC transporter permease, partial [Terriglobales bacterium]
MLAGWRSRRRDLADEIALHRELLGNDRKFGNDLRLRERSMDMWGWRWLETLGQDVRHGLRRLARTPVATGLALLSLTLGIGANTALFSLTDALVLRPLPVAHPEQLVLLSTRRADLPAPYSSFSNPLWEQMRVQQRAFSAMLAFAPASFKLDSAGTDIASGLWVSGSYFSTLGIHAQRGMLLGPDQDRPGCAAEVDISDRFWRSRFAAEPGAVGSTLQLNGHPFLVIGVTPAGFYGTQVGTIADVMAPICQVDAVGKFQLLRESRGNFLT